MINAYRLPRSLDVGGKCYIIRTDFRAVLDILAASMDDELDHYTKILVLLRIMYPEWDKIPPEDITEAVRKATEFIDFGNRKTQRKRPLVDWQQDAVHIISAVNKVAGQDIRECENVHWWTFLAWYGEIGESMFSNIVYIRKKIQDGKKLEKHEREFYDSNRDLIDIKLPEDPAEKAAREDILAWLNGGE